MRNTLNDVSTKPMSAYSNRASLARQVFYSLYYAFSFLMNSDIALALLTIPMFFCIIISSQFAPNKRIDQIDIICLIYFLFFCIVPLQQINDGVFVYGEFQTGWRYQFGELSLVYLLATFSFLCLIVPTIKIKHKSGSTNYITTNNGLVILSIIAFISFYMLILIQGGFENALASRAFRLETDISAASPLFLGAQSISTLLVVMTTQRHRTAFNLLLAVLLMGFLIISANPINAARFVLLGVWGPIAFAAFPIFLRPTIFYVISLFGLLVALPILSITTRFGLTDLYRANEELTFGSFFVLKNLNVVEMAVEAYRYAQTGLLYGDIMLSTILAHVPREFWPGKPIASNLAVGQDLVSFYRFTNENLAVPWFMDGYIDFGIIGSLSYSIISGFILWFLNKRERISYKLNGINLYTLILISNFLILARGTLAVVFSLFLFQLITLALLTRTRVMIKVPNDISPI